MAPLLFSFASAECYSGGQKWPDKQHALTAATDFCRSAHGEYEAHEDWGHWVNGVKNVRYNFHVWNKSKGTWPRYLSEDECNFRFAREIIGCERGGRREERRWEVM